MDAWSDKIRQNQERTHPRNDESSAGVRKTTERRLKWYGHVMRMEEDHVVRRVTKAIPGRMKRGRPKTKVEGCVQEGHAYCMTERGRRRRHGVVERDDQQS